MAIQVVFVILLAIATTTAAFNLYLSTQVQISTIETFISNAIKIIS